ncbi:MAG TPA: cytochrome c oxidase subunit 3 [Terriglobales bacterium]|jgi:cytochrome c oxidase subunit 3|nr:cytochrome c oxidase subunit 3 [Terriglobales bacterium]
MRWGDKPKGTELPDSAREEREPRLSGGGTNDRFPSDDHGGDDSGHNEDGRLSYRDRLMRWRLGLGLSMISILMLFIALSSAYMIRQHTVIQSGNGHGVIYWQKLHLPTLLIFNTILLLISSVTLEIARRQLLRRGLLAPLADIPGIQQENSRSLPWLAITVILAIGFLVGQATAWNMLQQEGMFVVGNTSGSFFYVLAGTHAIHLSIGILVLLYALSSEVFSWKLETRCLVVDVTSWYWHFMAVLWIYVYAIMHFSR